MLKFFNKLNRKSQEIINETQVDENLDIFNEQDLRKQMAWRYLSGNGIEIGALHSQLVTPPYAQDC